jgi:hypothetical protein
MMHTQKHGSTRQAASVLFAVAFLCVTTAATYPDIPQSRDPNYWERMVLTIGLGATLSLFMASGFAWLLRNTMRASEVREARLMNELSLMREAFQDAIDKIHHTCPMHGGTADIFERERRDAERLRRLKAITEKAP